MKNKKRIIGLLLISALIIIGGFIWWNVPSSITNIAPSEVTKIEIFDGNSGKSITITDEKNIDHIITNLNAVSLKREKISLGYMGYSLKVTIYKSDNVVYKTFIINSSNTIRKDPFFYRDNSDSIDFEYLKKLIESS